MKTTLISASIFWALATAMPAFAQTDTGSAPGGLETPAEDVAPAASDTPSAEASLPAEPGGAGPSEPATSAPAVESPAAPSAPPAARRSGGLPEGVAPVLTEFASRAILSGDGSFTYEYGKKSKTPTGKGIPETNTFAFAGARLRLDGEIVDRLGYRFQLEFGLKGKAFLASEAYASYDLMKPEIKIIVGQMKLYSLGDSIPRYWQFIKPGNAGDTLRWDEWDRGIAATGRVWGNRIQYQAHLVNGNGIFDDKLTTNDNTAFRTGLMLKIEPLGEVSPFADDRDRGPFRVGLGLGAAYSRDRDTVATFQDRRWLTTSVYVKGAGLYVKALFSQLDLNHDYGKMKNQRYSSVQAGYSVPVWYDHVFEPVARYTYTDPNTMAGGDKQQWVTVGCNYYLYAHSAKLQLNYIFKGEQTGAKLDNDSLQLAAFILF